MEFDVKFLSEYRDEVILIDSKSIHVLNDVELDRNLLMKADYYLDYDIPQYSKNSIIDKYKIIEKIIDKRNNLILIVERE